MEGWDWLLRGDTAYANSPCLTQLVYPAVCLKGGDRRFVSELDPRGLVLLW